MAESQLKRQREESYDVQGYECEEDSKRHKSYNDILSILEQEEDEPDQDLSDIFTSLQQELSSDSTTTLDPLPSGGSEAESTHQAGGSGAASECSPTTSNEDEEDERARVMRHLLEASDDELGIPNRVESGEEESNSGEEQLFPLGDWKWQLEDDAANYYYTFMQSSELFM